MLHFEGCAQIVMIKVKALSCTGKCAKCTNEEGQETCYMGKCVIRFKCGNELNEIL